MSAHSARNAASRCAREGAILTSLHLDAVLHPAIARLSVSFEGEKN